MIAIVSLLVVVAFILIVTRVASVALTATGLPREIARFQARSAITGVGFTTSETESVVGHPVRRQIVMLLMFFGNAGLITIVASVVIAFVNAGGGSATLGRLAIVGFGVAFIGIVAASRWVDRGLTRFAAWAVGRWTDLDTRDYANLLQLAGDYAVSELAVRPGDWLADRLLSELELSAEGVLVLAIRRADGEFIGAPRGGTEIHRYDTMILYGTTSELADLDERPAGQRGDVAHNEAVIEQHDLLEGEEGET